MPQLDLTAAALAVLDNSDHHDQTVALRVWKALTGAPTYHQALDLAHDRAQRPGQTIALLTGDLPDTGVGWNGDASPTGRLLVHVWPDGTGEVAYRSSENSREGWGVPSPLTPAP